MYRKVVLGALRCGIHDERPYVVMTNRAYADLGVVTGPLEGP